MRRLFSIIIGITVVTMLLTGCGAEQAMRKFKNMNITSPLKEAFESEEEEILYEYYAPDLMASIIDGFNYYGVVAKYIPNTTRIFR